jgi:hypothetical protein
MSEEIYTIFSGDGVSFKLNKNTLNQSKSLQDHFHKYIEEYSVRLEFIHSGDLEKIVEYMKFHSEAEKEENHISSEEIKKFDENIVLNMCYDKKSHLRFLVSSEKLRIIGLYKLVVHVFTDKIKDKGIIYFKITFVRQNNFTRRFVVK